jgi:sugar (pentulose or hexulose) kinase
LTRDILALDVGTTAFKMGVFTSGLEKKCEASRRYDVNIYDRGKADIDPEKWWQALRECCAELGEHLSSVDVVSLSVTTPGLTPMAADGTALGPAILFFDGRSHAQARAIRALVGEEKFLRETCNLPVSGGSSLASILWIRDNQPEVWAAAEKFGHSNTYMVKRFTGHWAIDPSTVSITGLYNTARHDLTWNQDVLRAAELPQSKLPPLMHSYQSVGRILSQVAAELGLPGDCVVLCGGNDAVLAALSGGLTEPGGINNICGTCEISYVCVDRPISSPNFNLRCHVLPNRWVTFFVLNTGGKALEWFHSVFCADMSEQRFFEEYIPSVLARFFASEDIDRAEADLPVYVPFLGGCRYTLEQMKASFSGVTLETTRDDMLLSLIRGNALYQGTHLQEVAGVVKLGRKVITTGGGARIKGFLQVKKRWTGDFDYEYQDQSSLLGAAMLGQFYQTGKYGPARMAGREQPHIKETLFDVRERR